MKKTACRNLSVVLFTWNGIIHLESIFLCNIKQWLRFIFYLISFIPLCLSRSSFSSAALPPLSSSIWRTSFSVCLSVCLSVAVLGIRPGVSYSSTEWSLQFLFGFCIFYACACMCAYMFACVGTQKSEVGSLPLLLSNLFIEAGSSSGTQCGTRASVGETH